MKLLDVNVWLAAVWARHAQHLKAKKWFDDEEDEIAFCRVTQMALLRLMTNPAVTQDDALTRRQAWNLSEQLSTDPRVRFLTANIDKFNNIIRNFSKDSQFVIVTHNKRTMISTDVIYGITMVEKGISRVVPVDLRELA